MKHSTKKEELKKYWEILCSAEAYLQGGWSVDVSDPPQQLYPPGTRSATQGFDQLRSHIVGNAQYQEQTQDRSPASVDSQSPALDSLYQIAAEIRTCQKCRLAGNRINAVPGDGAPNP
ncbi:MAG TPA: hypothetical protein VJ967_00990, partial [Clostridia bacterium]|nr:hypothetical protein [Clostridia bacterium]